MRLYHGLGGVGNQVAGHQRVFHAFMPHGNAIANRDGGKYDGGAAGHGHPQLDRLHNLVNIHVAGYDLVMGADNADQRTAQLLVRQPQRVVQ